jgi:hypothetical protein
VIRGRAWSTLLSFPCVLAAGLLACDHEDDGTMKLVDHADAAPAVPPEEPPVPINPVSPVRYPPALLAQGIEGRVLLRLYVDSAGRVIRTPPALPSPAATPLSIQPRWRAHPSCSSRQPSTRVSRWQRHSFSRCSSGAPVLRSQLRENAAAPSAL